MQTIGTSEAKTHLSRLLQEVAKGKSITITKHGVPVAMLVPFSDSKRLSPAEAVEEFRRIRQGITLGGLSIRDLIEEGRM